MIFDFQKLYVKLAFFCVLNLFAVGIIGSALTYLNVNSFIEFVATKGSSTRLKWIKKIVTTEAIKSNTENGALDMGILNRYLVDLTQDRALAGIWITDGNGRLLAGSKPQKHEEKKIHLKGAKGFPFIKYYFTPILIEPTPLAIALPGYTDTSIHMLTFPILPDRLKKNMIGMLFLGLLGLFFNGLIIYLLVSWLIIRPIRRIRTELKNIMQGNLDHRITVKRGDEIGKLAIDINRMAGRTQKLISGTQELSANLSHEIRTPLSQIRIASDILRLRIGKAGNQQLESKFLSIEQDIEKIDRLIDQVLAFSRYDLQTDSSSHEPVLLQPVLTSVLNGLEAQVTQKGLDIQKEPFAENLSLMAIPDDISLIFSNLLSNAVKYSQEKGLIHIYITKTDDAMFISIANTCEPMSDKDIAQIFEPFNKIKSTTEPGTKLGLTITRKIVDKYSGTISASRWKNKGLRMELILPIQFGNVRGTRIGNKAKSAPK